MKTMSNMEEMICYCFNYTVADIYRDVAEHGESTILKHILKEKQAGECDCVHTHPKGT